MKYLKIFEKFKDSLIQDVSDICLELKDIGLYVDVNEFDYYTSGIGEMAKDPKFIKNAIGIDIYSDRDFKFSDVSDVVYRLADFAKQKRLTMTIEIVSNGNEVSQFSLKDFIKAYPDCVFSSDELGGILTIILYRS